VKSHHYNDDHGPKNAFAKQKYFPVVKP